MPCDGYEHNSPVVLTSRLLLGQISIPVGVRGLVVGINKDKHKIDVEFDVYGRLNDLDAHLFRLSGGEGESYKSQMTY
jgi:hypothetical protein